jgi:hypothetical protein
MGWLSGRWSESQDFAHGMSIILWMKDYDFKSPGNCHIPDGSDVFVLLLGID